MIKNLKALTKSSPAGVSRRRKILLDIDNYTLKNLQPEKLLEKELVNKNLSPFNKIAIFAIGKAAYKMAGAVETDLSRKPDLVFLADEGHPLPTSEGVKKTDALIFAARKLGKDDLAV